MASKPNLFVTMIRALQRRPNEAAAASRVGLIAESQMRQLEDRAQADQKAAAALAIEADAAEANALRLQRRIAAMKLERQQHAEQLEGSRQQSAAAFARAVAAGDSRAEAEALQVSADVAAAPDLIARMDAMLVALQHEADRAAELAAGKRRQSDEAKRASFARRCEEAEIQFDEAANAVLLAAARLYAANESAGRMQPAQVQQINLAYFSRERSVYAEMTGEHEFAGHPPPVISGATVRNFVRAVRSHEEPEQDVGASTGAHPA